MPLCEAESLKPRKYPLGLFLLNTQITVWYSQVINSERVYINIFSIILQKDICLWEYVITLSLDTA